MPDDGRQAGCDGDVCGTWHQKWLPSGLSQKKFADSQAIELGNVPCCQIDFLDRHSLCVVTCMVIGRVGIVLRVFQLEDWALSRVRSQVGGLPEVPGVAQVGKNSLC